MCNHAHEPGGREGAMVVIADGIHCDPCIEPLIRALNDGGIKTVASCCGHGYRPSGVMLTDGRYLTLYANRDDWRRAEAVFPVDVNGQRRGGELHIALGCLVLVLGFVGWWWLAA